MTLSVSASTTQLSTFFRCRIAAFVELVCRRRPAGYTAVNTAVEAAWYAVSPARTNTLSHRVSAVDAWAICQRAIAVPSRRVRRTGVILWLALETFAAGQQSEHTTRPVIAWNRYNIIDITLSPCIKQKPLKCEHSNKHGNGLPAKPPTAHQAGRPYDSFIISKH